jgi:hypothetical protein
MDTHLQWPALNSAGRTRLRLVPPTTAGVAHREAAPYSVSHLEHRLFSKKLERFIKKSNG